ncbi:MAG: IS5 family transposase [bacterium]|nr:IS5 family transposase [bacterium]
MQKKRIQMSFSLAYVERRTRKNTFLRQIDQIIDWTIIEKEINKVYKKGRSVDGRPSYSGLILFKMQLLQIWYNMSDPSVEDFVNDSLGAMRFCGLQLEDSVPDHSTLSRFRSELVTKKVYDRLLRKMNQQLKKKGIMLKEGKAQVDASLTDSPWKPKGKKEYEIAKDRDEDNRDQSDKQKEQTQQKLIEKTKPGVDSEGRWVKKRGKLYYGYKRQIATDDDGMIEAVHTTTANEHDSHGLKPVLNKVPKKKKKEAFTDKGYKVPKNDEYLKEQKIKNRIQHKAYRNRPLTAWQIQFNKLISKQRYKVERTFGGMSRWFGAGIARYKGKAKTHGQHVMEAIAHNLKRSPGLALVRCAY